MVTLHLSDNINIGKGIFNATSNISWCLRLDSYLFLRCENKQKNMDPIKLFKKREPFHKGHHLLSASEKTDRRKNSLKCSKAILGSVMLYLHLTFGAYVCG